MFDKEQFKRMQTWRKELFDTAIKNGHAKVKMEGPKVSWYERRGMNAILVENIVHSDGHYEATENGRQIAWHCPNGPECCGAVTKLNS